jgi:hypothetical protein
MIAHHGLAIAVTLLALAAPSPVTLAPQAAAPANSAAPDDSPAAIDRLLAAASPSTAQAALESCRRVAAAFDGRDPARFLLQHGRALAAAGERDAAVATLARVFLLHPRSRAAPPALLAAARLLHAMPPGEGGDPLLARRLAERALATASALGATDSVAEAEAFLREPPAPIPSPPSETLR